MTFEQCRQKIQFFVISVQMAMKKLLGIDVEGLVTAVCIPSSGARRALQDDTVQ